MSEPRPTREECGAILADPRHCWNYPYMNEIQCHIRRLVRAHLALLDENEALRKDKERWDRLEDKVARREVADMLREDPFTSLRDHVDRTLRILDPDSAREAK